MEAELGGRPGAKQAATPNGGEGAARTSSRPPEPINPGGVARLCCQSAGTCQCSWDRFYDYKVLTFFI